MPRAVSTFAASPDWPVVLVDAPSQSSPSPMLVAEVACSPVAMSCRNLMDSALRSSLTLSAGLVFSYLYMHI